MKATFEEDVFSFTVESASGMAPYRVELTAENGQGRCSCFDWTYRVSPKIAKGEKATCKHVRQCLQTLAQSIVDQRVLQMKEEETKSDLEPSEYEALAIQFKEANPVCGVCNTKSTEDVHHARGRLSSLLCDSRFWIPVCRTCHSWIDSNRNAARELTWNGIPVLCAKGEWNSPPRD